MTSPINLQGLASRVPKAMNTELNLVQNNILKAEESLKNIPKSLLQNGAVGELDSTLNFLDKANASVVLIMESLHKQYHG